MLASMAVLTIRCGMYSTASRPSVYATHPRHGKATPFGSWPLEAALRTSRQAFRFDPSVYVCRWFPSTHVDDLKEGGKEETVHKVQKSLFNSAVSNIVYSAPAVQRKEQQSASTRITMFSVLTMQIVLLVTSMTLSSSWEVFLG